MLRKSFIPYDNFYYEFGRIPGNLNLVNVPQGDFPNFIQTTDTISPTALYKKFACGDIRGLVSTHFMAALNIYPRGNKTFKNAMSKFYYNLSMQALSNSDDTVLLKFEAINKLAINIRKYSSKSSRI